MAAILVVDDSTTMRQMVAFTLTSAGHEVVEAPDGNKALAVAKQRKFDLVITDVNMPGMNGIDLVQNLRGLPECKFIPILVLTTGWIVKPFNPEVLLDTLKKVLD